MELLERRAMMSATVDLAVAAGDTSSFTLIRDGNLVDVYAGVPQSGNFVTSVGISDANPLAIASTGETATVVVDPSGGNPLTAGLVIAAGNIAINQDLSDAGAPLGVTVDSGAVVNFGATQHLDGLAIQAGATANMQPDGGQTLISTTVSVAGTLNLADNGLVATAPTGADLAKLQTQIVAGNTLVASVEEQDQRIYSTDQEALEIGDNGELFAAPVATTGPATTQPAPPNTGTASPKKGDTTASSTVTVTNDNGKPLTKTVIAPYQSVGNDPSFGPVDKDINHQPTLVPPKVGLATDARGNITFNFTTKDNNNALITITVTIQ